MSKFRVRKNKGGFTLIEIMIVVMIIAILLAIAIPNFMRARETSRAKSCQANLHQIETAKEQCAMDLKLGATGTPTMAQLTNYMKAWPVCPSGTTDTYTIGTMGGLPSDRPACSVGGTVGAFDYHGLLTVAP